MLTKRYLPSVKNLDAILAKIVEGVAPEKFTNEHLKAIGFSSSNDRAVIPLLKDLAFLTAEGAPTQRYKAYRDRSKSKAVMAEALREAYEDVFHLSEKPGPSHRKAIEGLMKSKHNSSDKVASLQAATFLALLKNADLSADAPIAVPTVEDVVDETSDNSGEPDEAVIEDTQPADSRPRVGAELHYTIQVHLPATKEIEVYNAIFKSLRENLLA